jgi:AAA15 family ATPase/GTPase
MQLREFQVTNYRNVIDSGPIALENDVTCLVGKNESGKTALLQALYRVKPVYAAAFDESRHYPRQYLIPARRADEIDGAVAVRAIFALDSASIHRVAPG